MDSIIQKKTTKLGRCPPSQWNGPRNYSTGQVIFVAVLQTIFLIANFFHNIQWLQTCIDKVAVLDVFTDKAPNHVLINEYKPNEGILVISEI